MVKQGNKQKLESKVHPVPETQIDRQIIIKEKQSNTSSQQPQNKLGGGSFAVYNFPKKEQDVWELQEEEEKSKVVH